MHVAEGLDAVGFAAAGADGVVDGPGFFVALAGERVLGQLQVHVAEAFDAVGFAAAGADLVVDGPGFFVALAGERVLVKDECTSPRAWMQLASSCRSLPAASRAACRLVNASRFSLYSQCSDPLL